MALAPKPVIYGDNRGTPTTQVLVDRARIHGRIFTFYQTCIVLCHSASVPGQ